MLAYMPLLAELEVADIDVEASEPLPDLTSLTIRGSSLCLVPTREEHKLPPHCGVLVTLLPQLLRLRCPRKRGPSVMQHLASHPELQELSLETTADDCQLPAPDERTWSSGLLRSLGALRVLHLSVPVPSDLPDLVADVAACSRLERFSLRLEAGPQDAYGQGYMRVPAAELLHRCTAPWSGPEDAWTTLIRRGAR
jgi:hypothetical protein